MVGISNAEAKREQTDPMTPAVEFRNVSFSYDDKRVLNDLSFKLAQGEIKIILSGSGGGKSTILKLILGLLKPDEFSCARPGLCEIKRTAITVERVINLFISKIPPNISGKGE